MNEILSDNEILKQSKEDTMKKFLLIVGRVVLAMAAAVIGLLFYLSKRPAVANNYTKKVPTDGELEAKYLAMGTHEVSYFESACLNSFQKYEVYYPADLLQRELLPVVIFVNGTGVKGSSVVSLLPFRAMYRRARRFLEKMLKCFIMETGRMLQWKQGTEVKTG